MLDCTFMAHNCLQDQLADVPVYAHPKAVVRADGSVEALEIT